MLDKLGQILEVAGVILEYKIKSDDYKQAREKEQKEREARREQIMKNYALNCRRCKKLAYPIEGTVNRYKCSCGNQFASAKHPLN